MTNALRSDAVTGKVRRLGAKAGVTLGAIAVALAAVVAVSPGSGGIALAGDPLGAGGEFHSVSPQRIFDTRTELDVAPLGRKPTGSLSAGQVFEVPVVGVAGLPGPVDNDNDHYDDNVLAVVINITVIAPTQLGFLRAFPAGATEGTTSVVNFLANTTVPNTAVIRPGIDGKIAIRLVTPQAAGLADVAIDISGWFSTSQYTGGTDAGRGARLIPISPIRAYDSELPQFGAATLGSRSQTKVPILGAADAESPSNPVIPVDPNIVGVVVNVTGVNTFPGGKPTYLSALPEPVAAGQNPSTSTVNLLPGQVRANLAILPIGPDGAIHLFNLDGQVRLVVDIMGYLEKGRPVESRVGRVIPLVAPFRAFDTREAEFMKQPLGPARAEDWSFGDFVRDVNIDGDTVGVQMGLLGNLTATNLQRQYSWAPVGSFMTAYPSPVGGDGTPPRISNVNIFEGDSVPNLALLRYGGDESDPFQLRFYNRAGYVDYLLDVYAVVLDDDPIPG